MDKTSRQRILEALASMGAPICDDHLAERAQLSRRQIAYAECENLARLSVILRENGPCSVDGKVKKVSWLADSSVPPAGAATTPARAPSEEGDRQWYWEGNVQALLVSWLARNSYSVRSVADTAARTRGVDVIVVAPEGKELWVTAKGYPMTSEHTQARHWFAGAILDVALYRGQRADVTLAIALPDGFATYLNLALRVQWLRETMPFTIFWVAKDGTVRIE